jgi:hypothetical protein
MCEKERVRGGKITGVPPLFTLREVIVFHFRERVCLRNYPSEMKLRQKLQDLRFFFPPETQSQILVIQAEEVYEKSQVPNTHTHTHTHTHTYFYPHILISSFTLSPTGHVYTAPPMHTHFLLICTPHIHMCTYTFCPVTSSWTHVHLHIHIDKCF